MLHWDNDKVLNTISAIIFVTMGSYADRFGWGGSAWLNDLYICFFFQRARLPACLLLEPFSLLLVPLSINLLRSFKATVVLVFVLIPIVARTSTTYLLLGKITRKIYVGRFLVVVQYFPLTKLSAMVKS